MVLKFLGDKNSILLNLSLFCSVSRDMVIGNSSVPVLAVTKTLGDPLDALGEVGDLSN